MTLRWSVAAAVAVCLVAAAPAAATRDVGGCAVPRSGSVEAVGGRLVVWSLAKVNKDDEPYRRVFACRRTSGERLAVATTLADCCASDRMSQFRVAGQYVAYVRDVQYRAEQRLTVNVFDYRARRQVALAYAAYDPPFGDAVISSVEALALSRRGAVAWVVLHSTDRDAAGMPRVPVGLRAVDAAGRRLLDKGEGIDPASLRVDGSRLWWTNAGEAHSAQLR
jgi:hypothetical protein